MIRTGRRMLTGALTVLALAGTCQAEPQVYDLTLGALRVGVLEMDSQTGPDGYAARLSIRSAGLAGLVRAVRFEARATGTPGPQPQRYDEEADTGRRESRVQIDWQGGQPQVMLYAATPPETVAPPDAAATKGALDPVSAFMAVLAETGADQACTLSFRLFDGQRLSQVVLTSRQDTPQGLQCSGAFTRLAGYRPEDLAERTRFDLRLTYAPTETGGLIPVEAQVQTLYGKVRLKRR